MAGTLVFLVAKDEIHKIYFSFVIADKYIHKPYLS